MDIVQATRSYEEWMARHTVVVGPDLKSKHKLMSEALFSFFRATFYRWIQLSEEIVRSTAPRVLGIGDLHIENFGTWRDAEGRLIWGVNDFDEAYSQPYVMDLIRLAASAHLATRAEHLCIRPKIATTLIWEGYTRSEE